MSVPNGNQAPLAGLRVLDLADEHGELCGRILADLGAQVLRVEPPGGARSRALPPLEEGESLHFAVRNFNKRLLTLDLDEPKDRAHLEQLLGAYDVLIESTAPGELARHGLDPESVRARHPHLIVTSISRFGQTGPYRDWQATEAVLSAMGGMMFKAGVPEKAPLIPPATIAEDTAAMAAAFATLLARLQQMRTGHGQHLDVSSLEAVAQTIDWSLAGASAQRLAAGTDPQELRMGSGPIYPIYRCKEGYVRLVVMSPRQWRAMRAWLGEPEDLQDPNLDTFIGRILIAARLNEYYTAHFSKLTMEEASVEAQKRGIVCTPVLRPEQVPQNVHLMSRETFVHSEIAPGVRGPVAAGFFEFDGARQGFREPARPIEGARPEARPAPGAEAPAPALPLEGIRVLDFGIGGVGVECGRLLGEQGADVIKIESRSYPDFIRVVTGGEMCAPFASSSRCKRGFGVNAKHPEGRRVLHELIKHADVIVENNSTGTMEDMGVGWKTVHALNPRAVMVSSQLLGSRGEWADWIGYGPSTQPLGGLVHLWNYDDQDFPAGAGSIFPDHFAGRVCAVAAVAGLIRREHSGHGSHAEVAQVEAVTGLLGAQILKASIRPGSVRPLGNRSERGAPWGAYPCLGEQQWCVITVRDDDDWQALRRALGDPEWARDPALDSAAGRDAAHDRIDEHLGAWTVQHDKREVARRLQEHGVPCGPMFTACDQLDDPHFQARGYPQRLEQQDLGPVILEGPFFKATGMPAPRLFQAPRLGEHTKEICSDLLGMSPDEIDALIQNGALEIPKQGS